MTTTATTTGNIAVDIHFYGGSLTNTGNDTFHIPAFKQQFTTTSGLTYGQAPSQGGVISLATSTTEGAADIIGATHDVTMKKPTTTTPGPAAADNIMWGIGIPAGAITGIYSSSTNFIATSTYVNP